MSEARRRESAVRSSPACVPPLHADDDQPPVGCQRLDVALEVFGAHDVEDNVHPVFAGGPAHLVDEVLRVMVDEGSPHRALRSAARRCSLPAVTITRQPWRLASWIAAVPTPPAPPCTSTVSPACSRPRVNRLSCAVMKTSGTAAASTRLSEAEYRHHLRLGHVRQLGVACHLRAAPSHGHRCASG